MRNNLLPSDWYLDAIPVLRKFIEQVNKTYADENKNSFWACRSYFNELLKSDFVLELLNGELSGVAANPLYIPTGGSTEVDMGIALGNKCSLWLKILEPDMKLSDKLFSATENMMVGLVEFSGSGVVNMEEFEQPAPFPNDLPENQSKLLAGSKTQIRIGEVYDIRAAADIFRIVSVSAPVILLTLATTSLVPIRWEYDRNTLLPKRAMTISSNSSRLSYVANLLGEIGNENSIPVLKALISNENHFVRWAVVQNVYRLDQKEGMNLIQACLSDHHPHVRNAAQKSLNQINALK
jgi:hypothetical protein